MQQNTSNSCHYIQILARYLRINICCRQIIQEECTNYCVHKLFVHTKWSRSVQNGYFKNTNRNERQTSNMAEHLTTNRQILPSNNKMWHFVLGRQPKNINKRWRYSEDIRENYENMKLNLRYLKIVPDHCTVPGAVFSLPTCLVRRWGFVFQVEPVNCFLRYKPYCSSFKLLLYIEVSFTRN